MPTARPSVLAFKLSFQVQKKFVITAPICLDLCSPPSTSGEYRVRQVRQLPRALKRDSSQKLPFGYEKKGPQLFGAKP